jgi:hypothetical protein
MKEEHKNSAGRGGVLMQPIRFHRATLIEWRVESGEWRVGWCVSNLKP